MDLKGVNFCVVQFATLFTHVSGQYQTKNIEKKIIKILKLWSQIGQKVINPVYKMNLKKKFQKKIKNKKAEKILRNKMKERKKSLD